MTPDHRFDDDYRFDDLSYRITGRTLDGAGQPLVGCTVKLYQTIGQVLVATTISTAHGDFEFAGLSEDREGGVPEDYRWDDLAGLLIHHYIVAEHTDYTTATSVNTLVAGDHVDLTLTLIVSVVIPAAVSTTGPGLGAAMLREVYARERAEQLRRRRREEELIILAICRAIVEEDDQCRVA